MRLKTGIAFDKFENIKPIECEYAGGLEVSNTRYVVKVLKRLS